MTRNDRVLLAALWAPACAFDTGGLPGGAATGDGGSTSSGAVADTVVVDDTANATTDGTPVRPRRRRIDIDAEFVGNPGTTVLVALDSSRIEYDDVLPQGADVHFFAADMASPYPAQIERWDPAGRSIIWVRIDGPLPDFFWMSYADGVAPPPPPSAQVWDADFAAVWHMALGADGALADATSAELTLQPTGSIGDFDVPGPLGLAVRFEPSEGPDGPLSVASGDALALPDGMTVEAWVQLVEGDVPSPQFIVRKAGAYQLRARSPMTLRPTWTVHTESDPGGVDTEAAGALASSGWTYLSVSYDATSGTLWVYRNGASEMSAMVDAAQPTVVASTEAAVVGTNLQGIVDELRVSRVARSPAWMALQHASMSDTLLDIGPAEAL